MRAKPITETHRQSILEEQIRDWPKHLKGAEAGNPYATLCWHCYGRHAPPKDEICSREELRR